jgi:hypothetical protein
VCSSDLTSVEFERQSPFVASTCVKDTPRQMAQFFKSSTLWIADFLFDGRARRWYRFARDGVDVPADITRMLSDWHGPRARLLSVRPATQDEEGEYLRGVEPRNIYCPTGGAPSTSIRPLAADIQPGSHEDSCRDRKAGADG